MRPSDPVGRPLGCAQVDRVGRRIVAAADPRHPVAVAQIQGLDRNGRRHELVEVDRQVAGERHRRAEQQAAELGIDRDLSGGDGERAAVEAERVAEVGEVRGDHGARRLRRARPDEMHAVLADREAAIGADELGGQRDDLGARDGPAAQLVEQRRDAPGRVEGEAVGPAGGHSDRTPAAADQRRQRLDERHPRDDLRVVDRDGLPAGEGLHGVLERLGQALAAVEWQGVGERRALQARGERRIDVCADQPADQRQEVAARAGAEQIVVELADAGFGLGERRRRDLEEARELGLVVLLTIDPGHAAQEQCGEIGHGRPPNVSTVI